MNTPTLQSMKWWPGTLGKVATHALVYAQLILDGKEYGVHTFMVQVRDENHRPLPGIEVGDLGSKLGDGANDTGFLRLDNVRVPRAHMLARYQQVTPEGKYEKSENKGSDKLHYLTMMMTRGSMMKTAGGVLARGCTIATRYSVVRKQGFVDTSTTSYKAEERKILDHQVQRYRVFKQLALTYAMKFTGKWLIDKFKQLDQGMAQGNINTDALPEISATTAGLKGMCTFLAHEGLEDLRKCCGGNGYLQSAGLAPLVADYAWQTTAEGDFVILMLQTARFLIKSLNNARKKAPLYGPCKYLSVCDSPTWKIESAKVPVAKSQKDFLDVKHLTALFSYRALCSVVRVADILQAKLNSGMQFDQAWNECSLELFTAVRHHCHAFLLANFVEELAIVKDAEIARVLHRVCCLYACSQMLDDQWAGVLDATQLRYVRSTVNELLDALRPDAIALTDVFEFPDRVLNSTIGRYDGNIYEALFESAKDSSLNRRDPFDGYHTYLESYLDKEFLQVGNRPIPAHL